jgi:hypothetical protein
MPSPPSTHYSNDDTPPQDVVFPFPDQLTLSRTLWVAFSVSGVDLAAE